MLKLFLSLALAAVAIAGRCQFALTGQVSDAETGQRLPGATVQLMPRNLVTISDQIGEFRFDNLPAGEYTLNFTYVGYEAASVSVAVSADTRTGAALQQSAILTDAVVVTATRPTERTPTTFTTLSADQLRRQNFGQDVPLLLNFMPSVVTTSDAGNGIGYTGIRIRGSDPTRVNVTINGIPYNDSESLGTFWVDIPDIASSTESIQVQRGVGASTNGAGAFGATINLQTSLRNDEPYAQAINSAGSFNTRRHTIALGSGLLQDHWSFEGRVSRLHSDGFIDRAFADLSSYYFSGGYFSDRTMVKAVVFGGKERTYQAWYGVPESKLNNDIEAMEMTAANEGWNDIQKANLFNSDSRTFNPYLYPDQVDDYRQDHYQLHFSHNLTRELNANAALHYTPGKGYYEEYRYDAAFADYGLDDPVIDADGDPSDNDTVRTTDLVRRRWLDNDFYGLTWSLNYDHDRWNIIAGGGWNRYAGDHFGEIIWAGISPVPPGYRYYFSDSDKRDFNSFARVNYMATRKLNIFADLQYRTIGYESAGTGNDQQDISIDASFAFFNPKVGLSYAFSGERQLYTSFAVANREPVRDDFLASPDDPPSHETLRNLELGYRHKGKGYLVHANYYLMLYENQLVLTGEVNDVGAFVRTNTGESYRTGVELETAVRLSRHLLWNANVAVSRNKIRSFVEILEDYGENFDEYRIVRNDYKSTDISFSPSIVAASELSWRPWRGLELALLSKHVGRQYLDNTQNERRAIDPYVVNDVRIAYTLKPSFASDISLSVLINNILDERYETNGYTWGYLAGSAAFRENYYFPQAGTNFLAMLSVRF